MLYEFEMGHSAIMEATKNICGVKGENAIDYSTVTRWYKKFCLCCKNFVYQTKSGRPKHSGIWGCASNHRGKSGNYHLENIRWAHHYTF